MNFASYISRRRRAYDALAYENILRDCAMSRTPARKVTRRYLRDVVN